MSVELVGIALVILSFSAILYALLPGTHGPIIVGRLVSSQVRLEDLQIVVIEAGTTRSSSFVDPSGKFTIPLSHVVPTTLHIVRTGQPVSAIRIERQLTNGHDQHRAFHIVLGDIDLDRYSQSTGRSETQYPGQYFITISTGLDRFAPLDHQLLDQSTHWRGGSTRSARIA